MSSWVIGIDLGGASTTNVERSFSVMKQLDTGGRTAVSKFNGLKVMVYLNQSPDNFKRRVMKTARMIWLRTFGRARKADRDKVRFRRDRDRNQGPRASEAGFSRKRAASIENRVKQEAVAVSPSKLAKLVDKKLPKLSAGCWSDQHKKSLDKLQKLKRKREMMMMEEKQLLPPEAKKMKTEFHDFLEKRGANDKLVLQKENLVAKKLTVTKVNLQGVMWIDCETVRRAEVSGIAGLRISRDLLEADVIISKNVTQPELKLESVSVLKGLTICSPDALRGKGPAVQYKRATSNRQVLWMSPEVAKSSFGKAVENAVRCGSSKWTIFHTKEKFLEKSETMKGKVWGIMDPREKDRAPFLNFLGFQ